MNAMFVYTASSCGVSASGISETAPTVPWMVSSRVRPVNTRMVSCCSAGVSVFHDWTSLDSGTFSGSQKLLTRRFQTSTSLSSWMRFQLMASTWLSSLTFSVMSSPKKLGWFLLKAYDGGRAPAVVRGLGLVRLDRRSEHAGNATLHFRSFQRELAETDVVDGLDALAPGVDLSLVDVAGGGGVLEEQRQRQALVHVLGSGGVGVDDLLVADLVRVLVVLQVVVRQVRRRVVDAADLAFLADLNLGRHRVDRGGGVVDVGDRTGRRNGLQVLVVDAVLHDGSLQLAPVILRGDVDVREQLGNLRRLRDPFPVRVLVEELAGRVLGLL